MTSSLYFSILVGLIQHIKSTPLAGDPAGAAAGVVTPEAAGAVCNTQSLGRLKRGLKDPFCRACIPYIEVMQVALRTRFGLGGGNGAYHHPAYAQVTREMTGRITSVI